MNKGLRNEIELLAQDLGVGDTVSNELCPFCSGGNSVEKTFSVTRVEDGLLFNCYRASCPEGRGFIATSAVLLDPSRPKEHKTPNDPYYGTFEELDDGDLEYFANRFDLHSHFRGILGHNRDDYYVQTVRNPASLIRGYAVRRGCWNGVPSCPRRATSTGPKTRVYMNDRDQIGMSWYWPEREWDGRIVVVEDAISAMKVVQDSSSASVALLGNSIGLERVREIGMQHPKEVLIALDADATAESFRIARKWGLAFPKVRVVILERDLKDVSRAEVVRILQ